MYKVANKENQWHKDLKTRNSDDVTPKAWGHTVHLKGKRCMSARESRDYVHPTPAFFYQISWQLDDAHSDWWGGVGLLYWSIKSNLSSKQSTATNSVLPTLWASLSYVGADNSK